MTNKNSIFVRTFVYLITFLATGVAAKLVREKYANRYHIVYAHKPDFQKKGRPLEETMRIHPWTRYPLSPLWALYWLFPSTYSVDIEFVSGCRRQFRTLVIQDAAVAPEHSHGKAAALRTVARRTIYSLVDKFGDLQTHEIAGHMFNEGSSWQYHFATDAKTREYLDKRVCQNHVLVMVDVDYYVDMPNVLVAGAERGMLVTLLYTINPDALTGRSHEAFYWFERDVLHCHVQGGSHYKHKLWNYGDDVCVVKSGSYYYIFLVERRSLGECRYLTALFYTGRFTKPDAAFFLARQVNSVDRTFIWRMFYKEATRYISIASLSDTKTGITVTYDTCVELFARSRISEGKVFTSQLELTVMKEKLNLQFQPNPYAASLFALWVSQGLRLPALEGHFSVRPSASLNTVTYEPLGPVVNNGVPTMQQTMEPVLDGAAAPTRSVNSDASMVKGRFTETENQVEPPKAYNGYAQEFIELCVPDGTQLVPADFEEVESKQSRPTQKAKSKARAPYATLYETVRTWQVFIKREPYPALNNPRPICNPSTGHKQEYSRFTYPLCDLLCKHPWYAFGNKPGDLAVRIRFIGEYHDDVLLSDFSRWDGRHSAWLARRERDLLWRSFAPEFRSLIGRLWQNHYCVVGVTPTGQKFPLKWARPSGSPDTALMNTFSNAMIAYIAHRVDGKTPLQAWDLLGLYGGDDGFSPAMDINVFKTVCENLGIVYTGQIHSTRHPLTFLGRVYLCPKSTTSSIVDVRRALSKLHIGVTGIDPKVALGNKLNGYLVTDPDVPFFSDLLRLLTRLNGIKTYTTDSFWALTVLRDGPFPCTVDKDLILEAIALNLDINGTDLRQLIASVDKGQVPKFPEFTLPVKVDCVFRDRVELVPGKEELQADSRTEPTPAPHIPLPPMTPLTPELERPAFVAPRRRPPTRPTTQRFGRGRASPTYHAVTPRDRPVMTKTTPEMKRAFFASGRRGRGRATHRGVAAGRGRRGRTQPVRAGQPVNRSNTVIGNVVRE